VFLGNVEEVPPFPEATPFLLIEEPRWDDRQWLSELIQITAAALPMTKAKKLRKKLQ
jgi:hypothetical protein